MCFFHCPFPVVLYSLLPVCPSVHLSVHASQPAFLPVCLPLPCLCSCFLFPFYFLLFLLSFFLISVAHISFFSSLSLVSSHLVPSHYLIHVFHSSFLLLFYFSFCFSCFYFYLSFLYLTTPSFASSSSSLLCSPHVNGYFLFLLSFSTYLYTLIQYLICPIDVCLRCSYQVCLLQVYFFSPLARPSLLQVY